MRHGTSRRVLALAAGAALLLAAACGGGEDDPKGGDDVQASGKPLIFGTTESFNDVDPAATYDWPGSMMLVNTAQNLLQIQPGETQPKPDAAESCDWVDDTTYTCTLKPNLKFSDGSPLTSKDVKFSMDRQIAIADDQGPSSLFQTRDPKTGEITAGVVSTEAPDERTVTFKLKAPDATWPMRLTHAGAAIAPDEKYSPDKVQTKDFVGSGPYKITKWDPSSQIVLEPNPNYTGSIKLANSRVIIQKYKDEASLKSAVESGDVNVAFRALTPTLIKDLEANGAGKGVTIVKGAGVGISYIVFNVQKGPFAKKEVRQAAAYLLDRDAIAQNIYNGTVQPLYSMVPKGFDGQTDSFKEKYGVAPNPAEAKKLLDAAGVKTPVKIQLWWNPDHYGEASGDMFSEIERQLEKDKLFDVTLRNASWDRYREDYPTGAYDAFQLGWYPDFPDADNYLSPFYATGNFLGNGQGYSNPEVDKLLARELAAQKLSERKPVLEQLQQIGAEDVPTLPIWQDQMIAAVRDGVTGVDKTFDTLYTFRLWLVDTTNAK
ncbi:MAG TPA: ABC transporter substrate-binding protein [Actinopolymorphaceae bacterium]